MRRTNVLLIIVGILFVAVASFASPQTGFSPPGVNMGDREMFQVFLGIVGFSLAIFGIVRKER